MHGSDGRPPGGHPGDRSCPKDCSTERPVLPWLSPVVPSVASERCFQKFLGHWPIFLLLPLVAPLPEQGPFAPPALPGFVATTGPSAIRRAVSAPRGANVSPLPMGNPHGLPLLHGCSFPCVLPPLPRQNPLVRISLASQRTTTFPVIMAGRLLQRHFEACSVFTHVAARRVH